jgi:hypothetical protein
MNVAAMKTAALDKLGAPGIAGVGLLLFCLAFYAGAILPARDEVARLDAERMRLSAAAKGNLGAAAPEAARAGLPSLSQAPELLKRIDALAARHGVAVERGSYQLKGREGPRRLEVDLPLKAAYPSLRAFVREALTLSPGAALEEIALQRAQATEPQVDAQVRLSFAFAGTP